jgi:hypothetical protein
MLLMTLWWRRNKKCWHAKFPTIFYVVSWAREVLYDRWRPYNKRQLETIVIQSWTKPLLEYWCQFIMHLCYTNKHIYYVGACVPNAQGRFVQAHTKKFEGKPEIA